MKGHFELPLRMIADDQLEELPSHIQMPLLSSEECDELVRIVSQHPDLSRGLVGDGTPDSYKPNSYRICDVQGMPIEEYPWLYARIKDVVRKINETYKFDLYGLYDELNFVRYTETGYDGVSGRFGWHVDIGNHLSALRKLSISIALNDPAEYEGGQLQLFHNNVEDLGKLPKGTLTAFPSNMAHRVTPMESGARYVLVLFVLGPRFR